MQSISFVQQKVGFGEAYWSLKSERVALEVTGARHCGNNKVKFDVKVHAV